MSQEQAAPELQRERISAFIVCFNEEREIEECLETLSFCDEIVVIDSFSSDRTIEICEKFGVKVIQRSWPGYKAQKAFGLSATSHEWVINLDADERVSPELRENILNILRKEYKIRQDGGDPASQMPDGYEMNRVVYFLGRWWRRGGWYPEYRVRLMRKSKVEWGGIDPHERPIVHGTVARIEGELEHYTYRSLDEQVLRLRAHAHIAGVEEFKRKSRPIGLGRLLLSPFTRMCKFYVFKKGYKEGLAGVIVSIMEGFYTFLKYATVWELQQNANRGEVSERDDK